MKNNWLLGLCATLLLWSGTALAGSRQEAAPKPDLPANPADLVREAISNELKPSTSPPKRYTLTDKKAGTVTVKEVIETKEGAIARVVSINGKPLEGDQKDKEDKRLQRLIDDPNALAQKKKSQQEDDRRTRMMLKAMPDAFLYTYDGTEQTSHGEIVKLTFKPNPNWDPPSRETMVYRGMQGTMQISNADKRLVKIQAKLFRDVTFGWGILGHLDSGGQFVVEQARVMDHDWEITHMILNFTGKALVFKTIRIDEDEASSNYRPAAEMTAKQAIEELNHEAGVQQQAARGQK